MNEKHCLSPLSINSQTLDPCLSAFEDLYKIYPETDCSRCAACCQEGDNLKIYRAESVFLFRAFATLVEDLGRSYWRQFLLARDMLRVAKPDHNLPCMFWNEDDRSCRIHPSRPAVCRTFRLPCGHRTAPEKCEDACPRHMGEKNTVSDFQSSRRSCADLCTDPEIPDAGIWLVDPESQKASGFSCGRFWAAEEKAVALQSAGSGGAPRIAMPEMEQALLTEILNEKS